MISAKILVGKNPPILGRGCGQVVSVLAFYSNNLSLNPAEATILL